MPYIKVSAIVTYMYYESRTQGTQKKKEKVQKQKIKI